jgi:protein O-mannosyl-transferase
MPEHLSVTHNRYKVLCMKCSLLVIAVLVVVVLVYLPAARYSLVYDDHEQLEANPRLTDWRHVPGYFTTHLWAHSPLQAPNYYRPLSLLFFRVESAFLGPPSAIWHIASLAAHLGATVCLFMLIQHLVGSFTAALVAGALFALHPIQTETVVWISACPDILVTAFLVLSLYFYRVRKRPISFVSVLFAALAVFTKESGMAAPVLIFAYEWIYSRFKNALLAIFPYVVVALLYIAARINAIGSITSAVAPDMSIQSTILTVPKVLAIYALHLIWPARLSPSYEVAVESSIWPLLLAIVVLFGLLWLMQGSSANARFGAAWAAITLAPSLGLGYLTRGDFLHDRYLYLPSVGLAIIAAVWSTRIQFAFRQRALAGALALACCFGIRQYLPAWENDITLFTRAVERAPNNPYVKNNLADAYLKANRPAEAFPLLQQAIELKPDYGLLYYNMARYYRMTGDYGEAERYFTISDRLYPGK